MFNKDEIQCLEDLIYRDLAGRYNGGLQSIISVDDTEFNGLSPFEVSMRKNILIKLGKIKSFSDQETLMNSIKNIPSDSALRISEYLSQGRTILAIKEIRQHLGLGLKDAKSIIDRFVVAKSGYNMIENWKESAKMFLEAYHNK